MSTKTSPRLLRLTNLVREAIASLPEYLDELPDIISDFDRGTDSSDWFEFETYWEEGMEGNPDGFMLAKIPLHRKVSNITAHVMSKIFKGQDELEEDEYGYKLACMVYNTMATKLYPKEKLYSWKEFNTKEFEDAIGYKD